MVLRLLSSKWSRRISALRVLSQAAKALYRGNKRVGLMLLGAAVLAYKWSPLGLLVELIVRKYGDQIAAATRKR